MYEVKYNDTKKRLIINIDTRNANFCLHLSDAGKEGFKNLLDKVIDWKNKALKEKLSAEKEVGSFIAYISLNYNNTQHFVENGNIVIGFNCWFEDYDLEVDISENDYYLISVTSPNINISDEDVKIPAAVIFLKTNEIKSILNIISDDYIKNKMLQLESESNRIDQILN
jgi:hypothetical protein